MAHINEFRVTYSPIKTFLLTIGLFVMVGIFLLVSLLPFILLTDPISYAEMNFIEIVSIWSLPIIILPFCYFCFIPTMRHLKNILKRNPLVVVSKLGVKGYTPLGRPLTLNWNQIEGFSQLPRGNTIMISEKSSDDLSAERHSWWLQQISIWLPAWNPRAISIPVFYGQKNYKAIETAFRDFNPKRRQAF